MWAYFGGGCLVANGLQDRSSCLEFGEWHEMDFHALPESRSNPAEHGEGMALIVGILQPANDGCAGSNKVGKLALRKSGFSPELENFPGHVVGRTHLLERGEPFRMTGVVAPVQDAKAVFCCFGHFDHGVSFSW